MFLKLEVLIQKNNNPLLSKSTLKYLVYYQVFWVKLWSPQNQCTPVQALVFYYSNPNNLPRKKNCKANVTIQTKFFPNIFSNKMYLFYIEKWKNNFCCCLTFSHLSFSSSLFKIFLLSLAMWLSSFLRRFFLLLMTGICSTSKIFKFK